MCLREPKKKRKKEKEKNMRGERGRIEEEKKKKKKEEITQTPLIVSHMHMSSFAQNFNCSYQFVSNC